MKTAVLVATALLVLTVLSGCASPKSSGTQDDAGSGTGTASGSASKSSTGTKSTTGTKAPAGNGSANHLPVVSLTATPANGTAPLNVTFAVAVTDADGDALAWTLAFGNGTAAANGTATGTVSANITLTFAAGNHTILLNVTDGHASVGANATVQVSAGGAAAGPALIDETLSVVFGCELCTDGEGAAIPCVALATDVNEGDCAWLTLPAEAAGRAFTVTASSPSPLPDPVPHSANPDLAVLGACTVDGPVLLFQAAATNNVETGTLPAGGACLVVWDYDETWVDISFHIVVG